MFTVVIPIYNGGDYILKCYQNIIEQSLPPSEIVFVDDGSSDDTLELLNSISDPVVKVLSIPNGGPSGARNLGVGVSKSEYVAFRDVDDVWSSRHLESLADLIERSSESDLWCSSYIKGTEDDTLLASGSNHFELLDLKSYLAQKHGGRLVVWTSAVAVRKIAFLAIGGFDVRFKHGEDQGLWLKFVYRKPITKGSRETAIYVDRPGSLSKGVVTSEDGCMVAVKELISMPENCRTERCDLAELYYRFALSHVINALAKGDLSSAEFFLKLSEFTRRYRIKRYLLYFKYLLLKFYK